MHYERHKLNLVLFFPENMIFLGSTSKFRYGPVTLNIVFLFGLVNP